jgi:hypothetical protein
MVGEWNSFGGRVVFNILAEYITGFGGMVFRLSAGVIALAAVTYYLVKRGMPIPTALWINKDSGFAGSFPVDRSSDADVLRYSKTGSRRFKQSLRFCVSYRDL